MDAKTLAELKAQYGDCPKLSKVDAKTDKTSDYGKTTWEDIAQITKGYAWNGLFFNRKNSSIFYTID